MSIGVGAVSMRVYFSSYHLWAAKHFASVARTIEDAHDGPARFSARHRAYVTNGILSSVAFIEALINEFFDDVQDGHLSYVSDLTVEQCDRISALWTVPSIERGSILDKFQTALVAVGANPFDKGAAPYQDAEALVKLRNQLTHPRAETRDSESKSEQNLRILWGTRFSPNRLMQNSSNPYFPDHLLGAGCADWAVTSSVALADAFVERTGANANYEIAEFNAD